MDLDTMSMKVKPKSKKRILSVTNGNPAAKKKKDSQFASSKSTMEYFEKLISEIKVHVNELVELKNSEDYSKKRMSNLLWQVQTKLMYMRMLSTKMRHVSERLRKVMVEKRKMLDKADLRAKNSIYEQIHTQKKIEICHNYVPQSAEIELLPEEEFSNLEQIDKEQDPHQFHLLRLTHEFNERKRLQKIVEAERLKAKKGQEGISRDQRFLKSLEKKIEHISKTALPLVEMFNFPSTMIRPSVDRTKLPPPLFHIYYSLLCELHMNVTLNSKVQVRVTSREESVSKRRKTEEGEIRTLHPWRLELDLQICGGLRIILEYAEEVRLVSVLIQLIRDATPRSLFPSYFFELFDEGTHFLPHRPEPIIEEREGARCCFTWAQYLAGIAFPTASPDDPPVEQVTLAKLFQSLKTRLSDQLQLGTIGRELRKCEYLPQVEKLLPGAPKSVFQSYHASNKKAFEALADTGVNPASLPHSQYLEVVFERSTTRMTTILEVSPKYPDAIPEARVKLEQVQKGIVEGRKQKKPRPKDYFLNYSRNIERTINEEQDYLKPSNRDLTIMLVIRKLHLTFEAYMDMKKTNGARGLRTRVGRDRRAVL